MLRDTQCVKIIEIDLFGANVKLLPTLTCRVNGTFTSPIENLCPETVQIETAQ